MIHEFFIENVLDLEYVREQKKKWWEQNNGQIKELKRRFSEAPVAIVPGALDRFMTSSA